jgi:hypothetical protein
LWDGEEEPAVVFGGPNVEDVQAGKITLNPVARETLGTEEIRRDVDMTETFGGQRIVTISCRADNFLNLGEAYDLLERIRIRLVRRSSRKALREVGLAFVDATSITSLDYVVDQRSVSAANLDIRIAQVTMDVVVTDEALDQGEAIEKVTSKTSAEVPDVPAAPDVDLDYSGIT